MLNRTQPLSYLGYAAVAGTVIGYLLEALLTRLGHEIFTPVWAQGAVLLAIGGVVLLLAWRLKRELAERRVVVDPLLAVRILAAARAAQLLGALFVGFGAGLFGWVLPRLAQTAVELWLPMLIAAACGLLLAVMGVVAERWCRVPPPDDDAAGSDSGPVPQTSPA